MDRRMSGWTRYARYWYVIWMSQCQRCRGELIGCFIFCSANRKVCCWTLSENGYLVSASMDRHRTGWEVQSLGGGSDDEGCPPGPGVPSIERAEWRCERRRRLRKCMSQGDLRIEYHISIMFLFLPRCPSTCISFVLLPRTVLFYGFQN